jgi:hypothetical protein
MCHLPVHHCTDPIGAVYSTCRFTSSKEPGLGSRAYIPTWMPVARDEDGGSLPPCYFRCVNCKVLVLCMWIRDEILILCNEYFILFCGAIIDLGNST